MSIWPLDRNSKKSPLIDPEAHAFAPRQDGTNLENEAPNTFSILKKEITRINVLPAWKETTEVQYRILKKYYKNKKSYYQTLYSSQVDDPRFNKFFQNKMIKTLDNEQKERCEGLLTDSECRYALKGFQKTKSPGTDGLTAEFYSFFWDHLSSTMINYFHWYNCAEMDSRAP